MDEEKAAAYYEELTRKGGGAAKFKQGLGFSSSSSSSSDPFSSALKTSPFSLSSFVRASSPKPAGDEEDKYSSKKSSSLAPLSNFVMASSPKRGDRVGDHARVVGSIHNKLNRRRSPADDRETRRDKMDRRDEDDERYSSRKIRDMDRDRDMDRERERGRRRSRSYSPPHRVSRSRDRDQDRGHSGDKHRSSKDMRPGGSKSERPVDYEHLIEGYSKMTPAERVKAKMKLQLSQTGIQYLLSEYVNNVRFGIFTCPRICRRMQLQRTQL